MPGDMSTPKETGSSSSDITPSQFFKKDGPLFTSVVEGKFAEDYQARLRQMAEPGQVEAGLRRASELGLEKVVGQKVLDIAMDLPPETRHNKASLAREVADRALEVEEAVQKAIQDSKLAKPEDAEALRGYGVVEVLRNAAQLEGRSGLRVDKDVVANSQPIAWGATPQDQEPTIHWNVAIKMADEFDSLHASVGAGDRSQAKSDWAREAAKAGIIAGLVAGGEELGEGVAQVVKDVASKLGWTKSSETPNIPQHPSPDRPEVNPTTPKVESSPPPPTRENFSKLSVDELQKAIERADLDSQRLRDLKAEKQDQVDSMAKEYEKRYSSTSSGGSMERGIKAILIRGLEAATPAYYQEVLEAGKDASYSPFSDNPGLNRLYNIVVADEFDRVLDKIYAGAKEADPPVAQADPKTMETKAERVKRSRVDSGVHIDNPIALVGTLPATFDEWKTRNGWLLSNDRIVDRTKNYYDRMEAAKKVQDAFENATGGRLDPYSAMLSPEYKARQIGFPLDELENDIKPWTQEPGGDKLIAWLKDKLGTAEDVSEMSAKEIYSHVQFVLDYVREFGDKERKLYGKLFEILNDRLLLSKFFTAFNAAGKDDFGKAAKQLAPLAREVFGGKLGVERLNRLWGEAFPVMSAMEDRTKTKQIMVSVKPDESVRPRENLITRILTRVNFFRPSRGTPDQPVPDEIFINIPRVQAYLGSKTTTMDEEIMADIAKDLNLPEKDGKPNLAQVRFGIRVWRTMGRQALMDAYIPDPKAERDDKKWSGIRRADSEDKKLAQLMAFNYWGYKYRLGNNPQTWGVVDTEFRDFVSFMMKDDKLAGLGLARNDMYIVSDLSKGNQDALKKLDFSTMDSDGALYADWIGYAEHAGNTVEALTAWIAEPGPKTVAAVKRTFLHLFTNPWGPLKEGAVGPAPDYLPITGEQVDNLHARKWVKFFQIAERTVDLRTAAYQENPDMIITEGDALRTYAQAVVMSPSSTGDERQMELWMVDQMGATVARSNMAKAARLATTIAGETTKAVFGIK